MQKSHPASVAPDRKVHAASIVADPFLAVRPHHYARRTLNMQLLALCTTDSPLAGRLCAYTIIPG